MKIISTRPCLRLRTNLGPRIAFWGPDLGPILVLVLGAIFGPRLGPLILFVIVGAQNGAQKWNPKQGPKLDPNQDPKMQSGAPNLYGDANKVYMIFIQRSAGILFNCATNQQLQPKKEGNLGGQNCSTESMNTFTDQTSQDMFYLQKIHSQVSRMGKSTACLLLWGYAHASPQNCLF